MALSVPSALTNDGVETSGTSKSTATISPTPGSVLHAACVARKTNSGGNPPNLSVSTSVAGAWEWAEITVSDAAAAIRTTLSVFQSQVPQEAGSGTISFTSDLSCNRWAWIVWETAGGTAGFGVNYEELADTGDPSPSLGIPNAPDEDSHVYGVIATIGDSNGVTLGSGFSLVGQNLETPTALQAQYDPAPADQSVAWTGSSAAINLALGWELPAAAEGGNMVVVIGI
jgi:hypothetical protein